MNIVNIISGPLVGAVIGYFTNYIAVKMLFRPLHPVKIADFTLPFTPGIIPKRKSQLAQALGNAVGNELVTSDDLKQTFLSDEIKSTVVDKIVKSIFTDDCTIKERVKLIISEEEYSHLKQSAVDMLSNKAVSKAVEINLGEIIANEVVNAIKAKVQGSMLALMVNDNLLASFREPIAQYINQYIKDNGKELFVPILQNELDNIENNTVAASLSNIGLTKDTVSDIASRIYDTIVSSFLDDIISKIDIVNIVKTKIDEMDVKDIEKLVLSVMKKELDSIVNLGALIGLIIGIINIFI